MMAFLNVFSRTVLQQKQQSTLFTGSFSDTHTLSLSAEVAKWVPALYLNFLIPEQLGAVAQLFVLVYFHLFSVSKTH